MTTPLRYRVPKYDDSLSRPANVALATGSLASRLVAERRTRVVHPDGRTENVSEHSLMLAKVGYALACEMYPQLDRGKVVLYAIMHDDVEAYVGDTPTDRISDDQRRAKKEREAEGMQQLVREWTTLVPEYAVHVSLYEAQEDAEARFVRIVDKILTLLVHDAEGGKTLKAHWTFRDLMEWVADGANLLYDQYPEYDELINLRTEIAVNLARRYLLS